MDNVDYVACFMYLVPDANISYTGIEIGYEDIEWLDDRAKPTKDECDSIWPQLKVNLHNSRMKRLRSLDYQNISDPIFFKVHRGEALESEWISAVEEIKNKYSYLS